MALLSTDQAPPRCYACGRVAGSDGLIQVDLAATDAPFSEVVPMHSACARRHAAARRTRRARDHTTRRRLARRLHDEGHATRKIAFALGVSVAAIRADLTGTG